MPASSLVSSAFIHIFRFAPLNQNLHFFIFILVCLSRHQHDQSYVCTAALPNFLTMQVCTRKTVAEMQVQG